MTMERTNAHADFGRDIGPAMGLDFRHHVRGYALEQRTRAFREGGDPRAWGELLTLDNGELGEVIGDALSAAEAVDFARDWLEGPRKLLPRTVGHELVQR